MAREAAAACYAGLNGLQLRHAHIWQHYLFIYKHEEGVEIGACTHAGEGHTAVRQPGFATMYVVRPNNCVWVCNCNCLPHRIREGA